MTRWFGSLLLTFALVPFGPAALAQEEGPSAGEMNEDDGETRPRDDDEEDGDRRRRRGRGFGRGFGLPIERYREQLGLSEDQVAKLEALNAEMREMGQGLRELFQSGDMEAAREKMRSLREEMESRTKEILTPEQQAKMQELREEMRGRFRRDRGEGRGRGRDRERTRERLRDDAVEALSLSEEESAVVLPLLDTVLETRDLIRQESEQRRQDFLKQVRETTDPNALQAALEAFRAAREQDQASERQAMKQLREVLTVEQEAQLVALGVLE